MNLKLVIFDMDGLMYDTEQIGSMQLKNLVMLLIKNLD